VLAFRSSGSFEGSPSVPPGANLDDHLAAVAELRAFTKLSTLLLSITVAPVSTNVGIGGEGILNPVHGQGFERVVMQVVGAFWLPGRPW